MNILDNGKPDTCDKPASKLPRLFACMLCCCLLAVALVACSQGSSGDTGGEQGATQEAVEVSFGPFDIMTLAEMDEAEFAALEGEDRSETVKYFDLVGYEFMAGMAIDEDGMMVYDTLHDPDSNDSRAEISFKITGMAREDLDRVAEYYMEKAGLSEPQVEYRYTSETGPFLQYVGWCEVGGESAIWQLNVTWCWTNDPRGEIHCMVKRCSDAYINHLFEGPFTYDELLAFYDSRPAFVILNEE